MRSPLIQQVFRQPPIDNQLIAAVEEGETLRLVGANFRSDATRVAMDGVTGTILSMTDNQIDVVVPPGTLKIGLHSLQVVQDLLLDEVEGQPPVQRPGFRSNLAGFVLLPKLETVTPPAAATAGDTITVAVQPAVFATQEKLLLLGDNAVRATPVAFDSPPASSVEFTLPVAPDPVPPGNYLLRVRIDGAESRLTFNALTQEYNGPPYSVT
jgi:hypothetical protein